MFQILASHFIKGEDVTDPKVREAYGSLCSIVAIFANLICVVFKVLMGLLVHSTAIVADGINNLTDAFSNIASLFGFKLGSRHPDSEHPYGHGRYEYLSGMLIAVVILVVGLLTLYESTMKIVHPEAITFTWPALIVLIVSILIKFWMYTFNKKTGNLISSDTLHAAAQDSLNDVLTTIGSIVSLIFSPLTTYELDGVIGVVVSVVVLKSGVELLKDTMDNILGKKPDKKLVDEITDAMLSYDGIYGVHDMMIHDYGPGRRYLIAHLEVSADSNILDAHNLIDGIEEDITKKFNIFTTIHMDPIVLNDPFTNELHVEVEKILTTINPQLSLHDFRVVKGDHTKLIFDVLLTGKEDKHQVDQRLRKAIKELDPNYECVIQYDYPFV